MTLPVLTASNWKAWLCGWLRAQPELAALVSTRVYSKLPAAKVWPAVRVARTAGGPIEETGGYLHDPLFQLDVFADDEATAERVMSTLAAVVAARLVGTRTVNTATVTVTSAVVGPIHEGWDDTAETVARHRSSLRLTTHI